MLTQAVIRTKGRFSRLYETCNEEYWKTHRNFLDQGCSLHPKAILKRSIKLATISVGIIIIATLPALILMRGLSKLSLASGPFYLYLVSWLLFFIFSWIAHGLWCCSYMIGSKFASSQFFWGYIEKRWSKKIDEITEDVLHNNSNRSEVLESIKEDEEETEEERKSK